MNNENKFFETLKFLEDYATHFRELNSFLNKKEFKTVSDDIKWLESSLPEEQRLVMLSESLEQKRLAIMEKNGFKGLDSSKLYSVYPEELKGRLRAALSSIETSVKFIKDCSARINGMIEKKLEYQAELLGNPGIKTARTYNAQGAAVRKIGGAGGNPYGKKV